MKKFALVLALMMVACFMFVACEPANQDDSSTTNSSSTATQPEDSSSEGNSQAKPDDSSVTTPDNSSTTTPAGEPIWFMFDYVTDVNGLGKAKGDEFTDTNKSTAVEFTVTRGKVTTSSGKTVKEGTKANTTFKNGVQLGTKGTATEKCITFTVPAGYTTIELYVNCGSTGATDAPFVVSVNGTEKPQTCTNANITAVTVTVQGGDQIAIYSNGETYSVNVWGIYIA